MSDLVAWMADDGAMWAGVVIFAAGLIMAGAILLRIVRKGDEDG